MLLRNPFGRFLTSIVTLSVISATTGCISVKTHSTIDPIYLTLDVNLKVQLDKELNNAFADIDASSETIEE